MNVPSRRMSRFHDEGGVVSLLVLAIGILVVVCALLIADVGVYVVGRTRAQVAADAAALAAAPATFRQAGSGGGPVDEAARFAGANGAQLVGCSCQLDASWRERTVHVRVTVALKLLLLSVDAVSAVSSAEFQPTRLDR